MITIAIANQKGGVGKTTTAVTLGHALAMRGQHVLLIDADSQGHVALSLGLDKSPGLYRWILDDDPIEKIVIRARPNLYIVPGDKRTEKAKRFISAMDFRESVIQTRLNEIQDRYDLVLIDLAPSLDVLHIAALVACDWMIIPTRLDHLAVDGVNEVLRTYAEITSHGANPQGYSILPTFFDRTTKETFLQMNNLVKAFGANVLVPIPVDTKAREAAAYGQTLWEYAPRSSALDGYTSGNGGRIGGYLAVSKKLWEIWEL